jgi:cyclic dehypoxanthinyl futalosine synthase
MGISREQALDCLRSQDLIGIGMEAAAVRRRMHPEGVVSYAVEATLDCTGRDLEALCRGIDSAEDLGATAIVLRGDLSPQMVAQLKLRKPDAWLQAEVATAADVPALCAAGLDSVACAGAGWLEVHRAAHAAGIATAARVIFGAGESFEERIAHLEAVRRLQEETGGFAALAPVSFHAIGGRELDETTAVEYLKTLAVARMFVDNIENVQAEASAQGLKVLQMALRFGANDAGAVQAPSPGTATEEELRRIIRDAGFQPVQRAMLYRSMLLV